MPLDHPARALKLRGQIRSGRLSVDRQAEQLRASLTLSLELNSRKATEIAGILRNAALKVGLGWAETDGEFQLAVDYQGDRRDAKIDVQRQACLHEFNVAPLADPLSRLLLQKFVELPLETATSRRAEARCRARRSRPPAIFIRPMPIKF